MSKRCRFDDSKRCFHNGHCEFLDGSLCPLHLNPLGRCLPRLVRSGCSKGSRPNFDTVYGSRLS
jgi:hypothetical protein